MKYSESFSRRRTKFGATFYAVLAGCLLLIGGASWFALSNYSEQEPATPPSSENNSSYKDNTSSYTESTVEPPVISTPADDVAGEASKEPYSSEESAEPMTAPTAFSMPVEGEVLKDYSPDRLQYSATFGDMRLHSGIDIACNEGTAVSACADGTVLNMELNTSYGNVITIDHGDGITVKYAALDDIKVKQGEKVKLGDIIGKAATVPAECNDKSHIHIEVSKNGKSADPLKTFGIN